MIPSVPETCLGSTSFVHGLQTFRTSLNVIHLVDLSWPCSYRKWMEFNDQHAAGDVGVKNQERCSARAAL